MAEQPEFGLRGGGGIGLAEDGRVGVTLIESVVNRTEEPTPEDLRAALIRVDGTDYGVHGPRFIARFRPLIGPPGLIAPGIGRWHCGQVSAPSGQGVVAPVWRNQRHSLVGTRAALLSSAINRVRVCGDSSTSTLWLT